MILDSPPKDWRRPAMTDRVKRKAWEHKAGVPIQYDHRPPVSERKFNTETNDTIPPSNDPAFIEPISDKEHDVRTNGPGGERRITSAGSDAHSRAKTRALTADEEAFRRRLLAKSTGELAPEPARRGKKQIPQRANPWPPKGTRKIAQRATR